MSPEVTAAIIAASVSALTLIGTLAAQYFGRRATSRDTREALEEQWKQLERTLAEQRIRILNERFATAAEQLGSDKPSVRLAGVYAMAGLADDWEENRQICVDVLCAYLRMPYEPDPGQDAPEPQRLAFQAIREVRHTVIRVITAHLRRDGAVSWQGLNFDFTGVVFDGGDFGGAHFSSGTVNFDRAEFSGGRVSFLDAQFSGAIVYFGHVELRGGKVFFARAHFSGGVVDFNYAQFSGGTVYFGDAQLSGGVIRFTLAQFSGGTVHFGRAKFSGGAVYFDGAEFSGSAIDFSHAKFSGSAIDFSHAKFSGGTVHFDDAEFSGGEVGFSRAKFSGSRVDLMNAQFSGSTVDFSDAGDWSSPPIFLWNSLPPSVVVVGMPPSGVKLPTKEGQSKA